MLDNFKMFWIILRSKFRSMKCWYFNKPIQLFEIRSGICKQYMNVESNMHYFNCYHCPRQCKIRRKHAAFIKIKK